MLPVLRMVADTYVAHTHYTDRTCSQVARSLKLAAHDTSSQDGRRYLRSTRDGRPFELVNSV